MAATADKHPLLPPHRFLGTLHFPTMALKFDDKEKEICSSV
jgi:hypothetical protein